MQRRLDPETGANKLFENVFMSGARGYQFLSLFKRSFFDRFNFKQLSTKNDSKGVRGHAPPENFLKICILQWPF